MRGACAPGWATDDRFRNVRQAPGLHRALPSVYHAPMADFPTEAVRGAPPPLAPRSSTRPDAVALREGAVPVAAAQGRLSPPPPRRFPPCA
mgnify:CR=1 FL=1